MCRSGEIVPQQCNCSGADIKEQQAEIAIQKSEIETLKAQASNSTQKLTDLENKMNAMLLLLNGKQEVTAKQ